MLLYKLLKKPFFGRFMVRWKSPLTAEQQEEWQQLHFRSGSGALIAGLYAKTKAQNPKATIVLAHPMGKEAKGYFVKNGYIGWLLAAGYHLLAFDFNGFGESSNGNFSYHEDIIAAGVQARELMPGLPLGYHGISMGGQWAAVAFADSRHCYDFAIIESAATTLDEFWIRYPVAYKTLRVLNTLMPRFRRKINFGERIKEACRLQSLLFIYSVTDTWVPLSMGKRLYRNCGVPSRLWTVAGAAHAAIAKSDYAETYQQQILKYFNESAGKIDKNTH